MMSKHLLTQRGATCRESKTRNNALEMNKYIPEN